MLPDMVEVGVKTPPAVTPFPVQVPPKGEPTKVTGTEFLQIFLSFPAVTLGEALTFTFKPSVPIHPFPVKV